MNRKTFNLVVGFIGATLVLSVVGVVLLSILDKPVDDILKQLAVGSLTGLAGMLTRPPTPDEAQAVTVVNETHDPVPVDPGHADVTTVAALCLVILTALFVAKAFGWL